MTDEINMHFDQSLQVWEGFGCNYVEMSHSRDGAYEDYGSFSELSEADKEKILDMIFGAEGLQPGVVKMFLPSHLLPEPPQPGVIDLDKYRFDQCMAQTIYFAKEGMRRSRENGIELRFMITMYGPPAWANQQKVIRGKDLDPQMRDALATYLAGCAHYLREREGIPVEAISLHNEGEDPNRYPGATGRRFQHVLGARPDRRHDPARAPAARCRRADHCRSHTGRNDAVVAPGALCSGDWQ